MPWLLCGQVISNCGFEYTIYTGTSWGFQLPAPSWCHDDVIKWKHLPRCWPFVRGIHRSPVNSPHKGQWCGALMFSLMCTRINSWVNNREAGDLRRYRAHYDVTVMVEKWWKNASGWCWKHCIVGQNHNCCQKCIENLICKLSATFSMEQWINSSPPSAAYMHQWIGSTLVQAMACTYWCQAITWTNVASLSIGPLGTNFSKMNGNKKLFMHENAFEKVVCKNGSHFVQGEMI